MMTQFRKGMDALATYVGKEFGGLAGPIAAKAICTRNEPLDDESYTPEGEVATPGSVTMIKMEDRLRRLGKERKELERADESTYI